MDSDVVGVSVGRLHYRVAVPLEDHIARAVRAGRPYEPDLLEAVSCLVRPNDVAVDIGANIGNHTLYFALVCGMRVHAYEPNPKASRFLTENVGLNSLEEVVDVRSVALSDVTGCGSIINSQEGELGLGTASVVPDELGDIPTKRLDDVEPSVGQHIGLLKIDVEGAEARVLRGGLAVIAEHRPVIVVEADGEPARREIDALLIPIGYWRLPVVFGWTPTHIYLPNKSIASRFLLRPVALSRVMTRFARGLASARRSAFS